MVNPFTGAYAVKLGASPSLMGWFQSSSNISNNVMQVIWGRLSDRLRKRISFIILSGLTVSALWIPMIFVTNATQLIILLAVQALLGSMATPALTAIIGDLVPTSRFGRANASINLWASIGGLTATLAAGILMMTIGGTLQGMFFIPLTAATVLGIVSSLAVLGIKEKKNGGKPNLRQHFASDIFSVLKHA